MEWYQVGTIIAANILLTYYFSKEMRDFRSVMHNETKDFHGRLCKLEERYLEMREQKK